MSKTDIDDYRKWVCMCRGRGEPKKLCKLHVLGHTNQNRPSVEFGQLVRDDRVADKRHHVRLAVPEHARSVVRRGVERLNGLR